MSMRTISTLLALLVLTVFIFMIGLSLFQRKNLPRTTVSTSMDTTSTTSHPFFALTSSSFADGSSIPTKYTCDGMRDLSPALSISGTPSNTKSLALIMDDHDVPKTLRPDGVFDHWVLFNISPEIKEIAEGGSAGTSGANSANKNVYTGPCPPPQYEPSEHRYVFTLYALDTELPLAAGASKVDVLNAIQGHIIAQTQLVGRYRRN